MTWAFPYKTRPNLVRYCILYFPFLLISCILVCKISLTPQHFLLLLLCYFSNRKMGVVVLHPQDCLKQAFNHKTLISPSPMKHPRNPSHRPNHRAQTQPNRRKRSPTRPNPNPSPLPPKSTAEKPHAAAGNLIMGQVKILKRGEDLKEKKPTSPKSVIAAAENENRGLLGPDPESVRTQIRLTASKRVPGFYAGSSACIASPPPSSLPLPAFFSKKSVDSIDGEATTALLKALRLNLS